MAGAFDSFSYGALVLSACAGLAARPDFPVIRDVAA